MVLQILVLDVFIVTLRFRVFQRRGHAIAPSAGLSTNVGDHPYGVETTITSLQFRTASFSGDILVVSSLSSGSKVLVDFCDRDQIVELQSYRRVRLIGLPRDIQVAFGVSDYANAVHLIVTTSEEARAFSFDGSIHHAVPLSRLPDGVVVDVLPDPIAAGVRVPIVKPQPTLAASAAVLVAAA